MAIEKLRYIVTADTKGFAGPMRAIGALAVAAFVAAVKITAEFEQQLSKLRAISGATDTQMVSLEKNARELGKSTAFTAKEVASLQTELAKLGFTTNDILNSSGGVLDLAAALGVGLADAAVLTGSTIRAFGLTTADTTKVVDILATAASTSALDFNKMTESLKLAAPVARAANVSLEETVGILRTLADNGIHGSMAGTGLAKVFVTVAKTGRPLNELLNEINTSQNKLATATELFGLRANKVALIMASQLTPAVSDYNGRAEEMREQMEDNLIGDFAKLGSALTEMGIVMGQTTTGPLRGLVQGMTDLINGTEDTLGLVESLTRIYYQLQGAFYSVIEAMLKARIAFNDLFRIETPKQIFDALDLIEQKLLNISLSILKIGRTEGGGDDEEPVVAHLGTSLKEIVVTAGDEAVNEATTQGERIGQALQSALTGALTGLGQAIGDAITGDGDIGEKFLQILGSFMSAFGSAIIAVGVAQLTFLSNLAALNPIGVIAAGVALVAAGAIVSNLATKGPGGAKSGGSSSSSPTSSSAPDLRSIQGGGSRGRNVGGLSSRDGNIVIPSDLLRQASQASDDQYPAFG